ncbi:hypothetical protein HN924_03075 [Candidatus Woesearchaeota archaeon]|jgi:hypothetical protein|nr:hypothetical protein [Candidatus Woesearchaeota archaeon]MBT7062925.1 hypothetical protein [Candidatus Woesearchaeota archaeon]MBT7402633.1 hypothetical protein [Candidatus Woesearchaeota archaeon]
MEFNKKTDADYAKKDVPTRWNISKLHQVEPGVFETFDSLTRIIAQKCETCPITIPGNKCNKSFFELQERHSTVGDFEVQDVSCTVDYAGDFSNRSVENGN